MAFLFHSQLGRFSAPDEAAAASATDSDSYYGAGRSRRGLAESTARATRREEAMLGGGEPGSRRHRRFLNSTFAEYESEYDTASDFDSEEDRPIVRFEWRARFVEAGQDFFDRNADAPQRARRSAKLARRVPKMTRRRAGADPVENMPEEEESESHAHARRVRAAKFASHGALAALPDAPSPAAAAASTHTTSATDSEAPSSLKKKKQSRSLAGQEAAGSLFLGIEHGLRRALRKTSAHEDAFITELEALLIAFKHGRTRGGVPAPVLFDVLPHAGTVLSRVGDDDVAADDTEVTSDDEGVVHVAHAPRSSKGQRRLATSDEPLHLHFRGPRERFLAHGVASFHQLVCESFDKESPSAPTHAQQPYAHALRVTEIRIPNRGVLLHNASLSKYLLKLQQVPSRSMPR